MITVEIILKVFYCSIVSVISVFTRFALKSTNIEEAKYHAYVIFIF
jgi:hypothetical protein